MFNMETEVLFSASKWWETHKMLLAGSKKQSLGKTSGLNRIKKGLKIGLKIQSSLKQALNGILGSKVGSKLEYRVSRSIQGISHADFAARSSGSRGGGSLASESVLRSGAFCYLPKVDN